MKFTSYALQTEIVINMEKVTWVEIDMRKEIVTQETRLGLACCHNQLDRVKDLVKKGISVQSALKEACYWDSLEIVKYLVEEEKADIWEYGPNILENPGKYENIYDYTDKQMKKLMLLDKLKTL